jgi:hypothetical protein
VTAAHYRLFSPAGQPSADGDADVQVDNGTLVLAPSAGDVLRVPFGRIASVSDSERFTVRIVLTRGTVIELSRLGVMRTQLLAELRDGRAEDAAAAAGAVGEAAVFSGMSGGEPVELRVYDDALLVIGAAVSERISFAFVSDVQTADYVVTVAVAGRPPVAVSHLGRRTGEFACLLAGRLAGARGRTAAFLGALLPGLDPMALGQAASLLRDGVAVPTTKLDDIHPGIAATLMQIAVLPARREAVTELARRAELAIGFKQIASVRRAAVGVTPWRDPAAAPHIGEHGSPGGSFGPGLPGLMAGGIMPGGLPFGLSGSYAAGGYGFGGYGTGGSGLYGYWAFRALGAGSLAGQQRPMTPRPDVTRGRLSPATEDLAGLVVTGEDPTVLAFALGRAVDRVVLEILNQPGPMTFVYRADGPDGLAAINRALDDSGFQPAAMQSAGLRSPPQRALSRLLAGSLAGQVAHDAHWSSRLAALLPGSPTGGPS